MSLGWNLIPPAEWAETEQQVCEMGQYLYNSCLENDLAFDTETTGLNIHRDVPVMLSFSDGYRRFATMASWIHYSWIKDALLQNPAITKIGTNFKFDMHMAANAGVEIIGPVEDTLVQSWLHNENRFGHGLKDTARDYCNIKMVEFKEIFPMRKATKNNPAETPGEAILRVLADIEGGGRDRAIEYSGLDAYASHRVRSYLKPLLLGEMIGHGWSLWNHFETYEKPFTRVLWNLERRGFSICTGHLRGQMGPMEKAMLALESKLAELAGWVVNPQSPKQLQKLFFQQLNYPAVKYTDGGQSGVKQPSTDEEVLTVYAEKGCPFSQIIMEHRKIRKIYGTYIEGLLGWVDSNLRIHTTLKQHGTVTGRLSSAEPNLQNIPRPKGDKFRIREAFIADIGKILVIADYDQLEMKLMAHFCLHKSMIVASPEPDLQIGNLVSDKYDGEVYSIDLETKKKVLKKVVGHFKNGQAVEKSSYRGQMRPEDWRIIRHEGSPWRKLIITDEHRVFTPTGKKSVSDLNVGDFIYCDEPFIKGAQEQIILGSLLGDGGFKRAKSKTGSGYFESMAFYHGDAQKEYFDFKRQVLGPIVRSFMFDGKMHRAKVSASFQISNLAKLMRPGGGKKRPTIEVLSKLDARGLAIWYCDDGNLGKDVRCSRTKGFSASIANVRITSEEVEYINGKFDLDFSKWKNGFAVSGNRAEKFFNLVAKYVPHKMRYKLPEHWREVPFAEAEWLEPVEEITPVRIIEKRVGRPEETGMGFGSGSKYDITVEDTHNYFAGGVLVSNSGDPKMCDAINNGKDLHCYTVALMFGEDYDEVYAAKKAKDPTPRQEVLLLMRQSAKAIGFGLIYGIGPDKLAVQLTEELKRLVTRDEAKLNIRKYFDAFPGVEAFIKSTHAYCHETEYVQTILGRKRRLPQINARGGGGGSGDDAKGIVAEARRQSVNSIIQGTAADVAKAAMLRAECDPILQSLGAILLMQIHDELIWEVDDVPEVINAVKKRAKEIMEAPFGDGYQLAVPLTTEAHSGYTWKDAK